MGLLESVLGGLIVAFISGGAGYIFKQIQYRRKVRGAPRRYVHRLGEMIDKAYTEGPDNAVVHGRAIVATRDTLRDSLETAADKLNSQIDELAENVGMLVRRGESYQRSSNSSPSNEAAWKTIRVLKEYWPTKSVQIEYAIKKLLVELDVQE